MHQVKIVHPLIPEGPRGDDVGVPVDGRDIGPVAVAGRFRAEVYENKKDVMQQ